MIANPTQTPPPTVNGAPRIARPRRPAWWRRRRVQLGILGLVLLGAVGLGLANQRAAAPPANTATPAPAPLIAHGQIVPVNVARVGTQSGGIVQQLSVNVGEQVAAQAPLAWINGPSGTTEILTAPFAGAVTNVLVHVGDTLAPGAGVAIVADVRTLQVETSDVDEFLVSHIRVGESVTLTIDALDDLPMTATVGSMALLPQTGTGGTQQYPVILRLSSVPLQVRPGMSVRITFPD